MNEIEEVKKVFPQVEGDTFEIRDDNREWFYVRLEKFVPGTVKWLMTNATQDWHFFKAEVDGAAEYTFETEDDAKAFEERFAAHVLR